MSVVSETPPFLSSVVFFWKGFTVVFNCTGIMVSVDSEMFEFRDLGSFSQPEKLTGFDVTPIVWLMTRLVLFEVGV